MIKTEKSVREKHFPSVKKSKKPKKMVFTGTFFFHGKKKTLPQSTRTGPCASPSFRRGRIASTYTTRRLNEDCATTIFRQSENSLKDKSGTEDSQLGCESKPLDGNTSHLEGGSFTDPEIKLAESDYCYFWNYGHPCKIITEGGLCRKLHICLHENCRTLFHHGHRWRDHNNGSL